MFAYGYKNLGAAYDLVASTGIGAPRAARARAARSSAPRASTSARASTDIARLQPAPADFFA